jgi:CheY-like chemotaxis protein
MMAPLAEGEPGRPPHTGPETPPGSPAASGLSAGRPPVKLPPPWILIADDDPVIRDVWTAALRRAGYRTAYARDGGEALERMRMLLPDLMILDLRMPELSGDAVLKRISERPTLSRIPVLIISGFLDDEPLSDHGLNIVGRLRKPQSLDAVVRAVRAALAQRPPA